MVTNRVTRPFAGRLPLFAVVEHRGRSSGRTYRTPVNAFEVPGGFIVALTYGPDSDWAKNVLAAGRCRVLHRARWIEATAPRLVDRSEGEDAVPDVVRAMLRLLNVSDFIRLDRAVAPRG